MTTYERITYKPEGAQRARSVILRNPVRSDKLPGGTTSGVEVKADGEEVYGPKFDERVHIISDPLILKRVPLKMNLHYGRLERV